MSRPIRATVSIILVLGLALGLFASGVGTAGQHYTALVSNAARAVGSFVSSVGEAGRDVSIANGLEATVSFEYVVGSQVANPSTDPLFAEWFSCVKVSSGESNLIRECARRIQLAVVDPLLLVAVGRIVTRSCTALIVLTARSVAVPEVVPFLDIVPERISIEAAALVFGKRPAVLRVGTIRCNNGIEGSIVNGTGTISRTYYVDARSSVVEPTPTPTESPPPEEEG